MFITLIALAVIVVSSVAPCGVPRNMPRVAADDTLSIFDAAKSAEVLMKEQPMAAKPEEIAKTNDYN